MNRILKDSNLINTLALNLSRSEKVNSFNGEGIEECGQIAHSLSDMESSMFEVYEKLLPKLLHENITPDKIEDVLFDIAEELRHVLYHIKTPRYWKHIVSED